MKKLLITLLLIIFSSSFSLANDNEKITIEEIEDIFLKKIEFRFLSAEEKVYLREQSRKDVYGEVKQTIEGEAYKKRLQTRGIAKCMYDFDVAWSTYLTRDNMYRTNEAKKCLAKVIRVVFTTSDKGKKRRPGDIFYALAAIKSLIYNWENRGKFIKYFTFNEGDKPVPGMVCGITYKNYKNKTWKSCKVFKKSTLKKIDKFKKDPSNEKVLGHKLIKFIKNVRMMDDLEEKLGAGDYYLLGDFLNATVADVEKNNINPGLQKRRVLLKKYSLIMRIIKKKLDEEKYKSIDKDVSKLSKTYENLNALTTNSNETVINIDKAINIIFDTNKLVQSSVLSAINNEEEKLLALASIDFMQTLIDSIISTIPEKYLVYTKELSKDLFSKSELAELENIIIAMTNKNKEIKSTELKKNMDIINKFINPSNTLKKLNSLGIINSADRPLTRDSTVEIINQEIKDNLDNEVLKDVRKRFQ